jgi:hypothetical protein
MEHSDDAPLADDGDRGPVPDDQPLGGPAGPEDENMPSRPLTPGPGEEGPREPAPEKEPGRA